MTEHSENQYLHDMLVAAARAVIENKPVDKFEIAFERDRETESVTGRRIRGDSAQFTEVTFRIRFVGDMTLRPGKPDRFSQEAGE